MPRPDRIYLDNAATSFPKPEAVLRAVVEYSTKVGASPGRGSYAESLRGAEVLWRCRERLCELFGGASPDHVVFTHNCTDALNLAIHGLVKGVRRREPGRPIHIVTTTMDHNSVLRPCNDLRAEGVEVTRVPADAEGFIDPQDIARAIRPDTRLVAMVHASNVTGTLQDVGVVGAVCRSRGVPLLVDAAQSLGHLPVDVGAMGIDLLAFPGHKGLMGPSGTGGLYLRPGMEALVEPVRQGGTGSRSESDTQPTDLPDRYEPGSHNTLGIAGLLAGVEWLLDRGIDDIRAHETALMGTFLDAFPGKGAGYRLLGPTDPAKRVGVFAITHDRLSPALLASELERRAGVLCRAGLHCAPGAHETMGTIETGGACRLSVGAFTSVAHIRTACACLTEIAREAEAGPPVVQSGLGSSIHPASV
jgi:cysteine desulfurase family protein